MASPRDTDVAIPWLARRVLRPAGAACLRALLRSLAPSGCPRPVAPAWLHGRARRDRLPVPLHRRRTPLAGKKNAASPCGDAASVRPGRTLLGDPRDLGEVVADVVGELRLGPGE